MKLNNRGAITLFLIAPYIIGAGFAVIGYGAVTTKFSTQSFRERKANEYCLASGKTSDFCKTAVNAMSKDEVLAYIKDTQEQPR